MTNLVRIELLKLRTTRAAAISVAVIVIVTVASVLTTIWTAGQHGAASLGTTANVSKTLSVAALTSMVMMVLGILSVGGEHRHRTIVGSYLAEPRRGRVLLAKLASTGALGAVVGALTFGLALALAVPTFASRGVHQLGVDVPQLWLGAALASACFALLGVALGAVTRNTVGAIVAALVWAQLIEVGILQNLIPSLAKWLPTGAAVALTTVGDNAKLLSPYAAAAALVGWTAVLCLVAAVISMRREVK
jgi:ABC-type transport system involved in multi-copper enzyme maturation permease subunit